MSQASTPFSTAIIIAAYNASATIERAVRSALSESEVSEVIVVDDASSDGTSAKAMKADDGSGRLKILVQPLNKGPSAARNRAISESKSKWIGILDADDFFLPGRFNRLLNRAEDADLIGDDAVKVAENSIDGPRVSLLGNSFSNRRTIDLAGFVKSNVSDPKRQRGELGFLKPIMRRDFLLRHNLYYCENMRLGEDYELYARALALGARFYIIPEAGYVSVVRSSSLSGQHSEKDLLNLRECDNQLLADFNLSRDEKMAINQHYKSVDCRLQWRLLINAVKQKNLKAAVTTIIRPWPVPIYLCVQLWEEFKRRLSNKLGRG